MASRTGSGALIALTDQLLLTAFADDETARHAWSAAAPTFVLDELPFDLHGLFPIIGQRLRSFGVDSPDLSRFDGMRKRLWSRNVLRMRAIGRAVETLADRGISPILTGGAAVLAHNGNWGLRSLTEVDLAIHQPEAEAANSALTAAGWRIVLRRRDGFLLDMRACVLELDGQQVTLRWPVSHLVDGWAKEVSVEGGVDDVVADVGGRDVRLAPRSDVLAFIATDALSLPGYQLPRRLSDALMLLAGDEAMSAAGWSLFLQRIAARNAEPEALEFLRHLGDRLQAAVPAEVLARLATRNGETARLPRLARQSVTVAAFARRQRTAPRVQALVQLPSYLAEVWDLEHRSQLPAAILTRGVRAGVRSGRALAMRRRHQTTTSDPTVR